MINNFLRGLGVAAFGIAAFGAVNSGNAIANPMTGHCVEQVSIKIENSSNTVINSGGADLRNPYMLLSVGGCYTQTVTDFNANTSWSNPGEVCARYKGFGVPNGHFFVMATAYFQELGNGAGVNRVAGYDMHCKDGKPRNVNTLSSKVVVVPTIY
jgi:hypothetical protein